MLSGVALALWGVAYAAAASRPSPRGRPWPRLRTVSFLAGVALLIVVVSSGLQVYENDPTVHVAQHVLEMMVVPALLVFGAPITLLLRTRPQRRRRTLVRELQDGPLRRLSGPQAAILLSADYYLTMYVYQLTPVREYVEHHALAHVAVHQYFLLCGLAFWWPIAGIDPVRFRPSPRVKQLMIGAGLPAFVVLGGIEAMTGDVAAGRAYIVGGVMLTLSAAAAVARHDRRDTPVHSAPSPARPGHAIVLPPHLERGTG